MPEAALAIIRDRLTQLVQQPASGLGIGLVVSLGIALWSGSRGVNALVLAIGEAYHEDDDRGFLASALLSIGLTLGGIVFVGVALAAIAVVPAVLNNLQLGSTFETAVNWLRWPLLALFVIVAVAVLYRLAPDRDDARWEWLTPGAVTATVLWLVLSALFSLYVEYFGNYSATFGSLAGRGRHDAVDLLFRDGVRVRSRFQRADGTPDPSRHHDGRPAADGRARRFRGRRHAPPTSRRAPPRTAPNIPAARPDSERPKSETVTSRGAAATAEAWQPSRRERTARTPVDFA